MPERSVTDIESLLELAKMNREEMLPAHQSIFFSSDINEDLVLLEVDKNVLSAIESGSEVVFRGDAEDEVVLCTSDKTYSVQEAEISNSLQLLPNLSFPNDSVDEPFQCHEVLKTFHIYWETKRVPASLQKLYKILSKNVYEGTAAESEKKIVPCTLETLLESVRSSRIELDEGIEKLPVVNINGNLRLLDPNYHFRVLDFVLKSIDANSFPFDKIDRDVVLDEVSELEPSEVVKAIIKWYTDLNEDGTASLKKDLVCRFIGEVLLQHGSKFRLSEFESIWRESVPSGLETNLDQLAGTAVINRDVSPVCISYLSVWSLSEDPAERFRELFRVKDSWSLKEIEPYIQDLAIGGVNALLMKFARAFKRNGECMYSKR